mmetsp:Transcript_22383/g.52706  ORF Transcript_22383/g.52706 Transcript_22383/m.52706 type:complete len:352 (-) Transcript_22383:682-1737(-)
MGCWNFEFDLLHRCHRYLRSSLHPLLNCGSQLLHERRHRHGETHAGEQESSLVLRQNAHTSCRSKGHKRKFPALAQYHAHTLCCHPWQTPKASHRRGNGRLGQQNGQHRAQNGPSSLGTKNQTQVNFKSNREKEESHQNSTEGRRCHFDGMAVFCFGNEHARQESAQGITQAQALCEKGHSQDNGQDQTNQGFLRPLDFVRDHIQKRYEQSFAKRSNHGERQCQLQHSLADGLSQGRRAIARQNWRHDEERYHHQILQQQGSKGRLAILRFHLSLILEQLQDKGRTTERQTPPNNHSGSGRLLLYHTHKQSNGQRRDGELTQPNTKHVSFHAHERFEIQMNAHFKQKEHNP